MQCAPAAVAFGTRLALGAQGGGHTHYLRAEGLIHNPWGAAPCFLFLFFFTEAHRTRGGGRPVIWFTAKPIADARAYMPGKALDPRRRGHECVPHAVLAVGRAGERGERE